MSSSRNMPPQLLAVLAQMLAHSVTNAIAIDSKSSVPVREQIAIQIDAFAGEEERAHTETCKNCAAKREELIERLYNEYLAETGDAKIEEVEATAAANAQRKDGASAAFEAPYGAEAKQSTRKVGLFAVVIQRDGKDVVLAFTAADTPDQARAHLTKAEQRMSITFNEFEIKPLYL